jgi:hypothetical protein
VKIPVHFVAFFCKIVKFPISRHFTPPRLKDWIQISQINFQKKTKKPKPERNGALVPGVVHARGQANERGRMVYSKRYFLSKT